MSTVLAEKLDKQESSHPRLSEALGVLLLAFSLAILLSLISYDPLDPAWNVATTRTHAINWIGSFGAWLADGLFQIFGLSAFLIPVLFTTIGWRMLRLRQLGLLRRKFLGLLLLLVAVAGLLSLPQMPFYRDNIRFGGATGYLLARLLELGLNKMGTGIALTVMLIFAIMMTTPFSFNSLLDSARTRSLIDWFTAARLALLRQWTSWQARRAKSEKTREATRQASARTATASVEPLKTIETAVTNLPPTENLGNTSVSNAAQSSNLDRTRTAPAKPVASQPA
ncbi:MAG: DNA translocase FtsK 4TM domain-containing protein, partial [Acidobacteriota bacterium]